jgi:hypothetical protein
MLTATPWPVTRYSRDVSLLKVIHSLIIPGFSMETDRSCQTILILRHKHCWLNVGMMIRRKGLPSKVERSNWNPGLVVSRHGWWVAKRIRPFLFRFLETFSCMLLGRHSSYKLEFQNTWTLA